MKRLKLLHVVLAAIICLQAGPASAKWTSLKNISQFGGGRWGAMSFVLNGTIYAGGGYYGNFKNLKDFQKYDIATNKWSTLKDLPGTVTSRTGGISFVVNGKAYLGLGEQDYNGFNPNPVPLKDLWEYDAAGDKWTARKPLPDSGLADAATIVVNNKVYIIGGRRNGNHTDKVWEYDPAGDKWTAKKAFPLMVSHATSFVLNGKGYVVGGEGASSAMNNKTYEYDPAGDKWIEKKSYPEQDLKGAVAFVMNGKAFVGLGGQDPYSANAVYHKTFYYYDAAKDAWSYAQGHEWTLDGRMFGIAQVVNNKAYVGFGWRIDGGNQTFYSDFNEIDPAVALNVEDADMGKLSIYPNPAKNVINITGVPANSGYEVYDLTGKMVQNGKLNNQSVDISSIASGYYVVQVNDGANILQKMILKQ